MWLCMQILPNTNAALNERDFQAELDPHTVEFAQNLVLEERGRDMQRIVKGSEVVQVFPQAVGVKQSEFYVFVSLSIHDKNLMQLLDEAAKYRAIVVLRGLKNNSMRETVQHLAKFFAHDHNGLIIDPELFRKYRVNKVPSFVLADGERYDIMSGNVTAHFALEKFAVGGDCGDVAKGML